MLEDMFYKLMFGRVMPAPCPFEYRIASSADNVVIQQARYLARCKAI